MLDERRVDAVPVGRVGDEHLGLRVGDAVADAVVAVEDRHREQDRARLVGAEERGGRLGRRRQQHRDAVALLDAVRAQHVGEAVGELLQLAPLDLADVAVEVLVDHRELVGRVLVAHVLRRCCSAPGPATRGRRRPLRSDLLAVDMPEVYPCRPPDAALLRCGRARASRASARPSSPRRCAALALRLRVAAAFLAASLRLRSVRPTLDSSSVTMRAARHGPLRALARRAPVGPAERLGEVVRRALAQAPRAQRVEQVAIRLGHAGSPPRRESLSHFSYPNWRDRQSWVCSADASHRLPLLARADPAEPPARARSATPRPRASARRCRSDHFSPWSERQGESGFAWSFLGAALAATALPFGVVNAPGQRYHPAIIAQAAATLCRDVPGRLWVALGTRRGVQRAHHRRALAAQGDAQRAAARVRRRHARAVRRRGRRPRRARARRPRAAVDAARGAAAADRRGGERGDGALGGRVGRRAGHDQPAARAARARCSPRSARAAARASRLSCRCTSRGRRTRRRRSRSPTTSGARTSSSRRLLGPRNRRAVRRGRALRAPRGRARQGAGLGRPRRSTSRGCRSSPSSASTRSTSTTSARTSTPFIDAFGEHVLPELRHERARPPATCGGRTRSSTASTSRRSSTPTATAAATSPG